MSYEIYTPVTYRLRVTHMGAAWDRRKVYYHIGHALRSYFHYEAKYQGVSGVQLWAYIGDKPVMMIDVNSLVN